MDVIEAKVRLLELAATMLRRDGIPIARDVVNIATVMYDYINAPSQTPETGEAATTDKPRKTRNAKADPFS